MNADNPTRVLLLDDERVIVDTLCIILNRHGFAARGAYTHAQAVQAAREFQPNVFITGMVNCCEKNGCETAAEIVDLFKDCRVFIFSGSGYEWAVKTAKEYRKHGYEFSVHPKPVHPQDLLPLLNAL